jgi:hypothetical protein
VYVSSNSFSAVVVDPVDAGAGAIVTPQDEGGIVDPFRLQAELKLHIL